VTLVDPSDAHAHQLAQWIRVIDVLLVWRPFSRTSARRFARITLDRHGQAG
jgi:hypothetical protein